MSHRHPAHVLTLVVVIVVLVIIVFSSKIFILFLIFSVYWLGLPPFLFQACS
jgi:hypothetical protein